ncbi:pimeloyl-ACP methyl ester carboxylesterase [Methanolinea mesophila]|uniref:alpha/beta fold hydrolase n=1 Tax=Methanolinea mesophila TaxID=547055 RepID=UPI001AE3A2D3|nr:alpha/beta hydrolase [Methanolinea mesophila]MBP1927795.1 pimeloyl-ACP methyl ester carboxylesterase [Methanolinea mesophila]
MTKPMLLILAVAVTFCFVLAAGCTTSPVNDQGSENRQSCQDSISPCQKLSPVPGVSINGTPIQYADVNGVRLAYREFGSGEPLLMLNGFGATMDSFYNESFLGILATRYHVYIYDHRGMGYSSDNNATPTMSLYADDAAGLMSALGYDSMNVYGASMGSSIGQQLVIDHPGNVRKLILESATYDVRIPETKLLFDLIRLAALDPSQTAGVHREAEANLVWNGTWNGLSGINKSVMLVVGTNDLFTPQAVSVQMAGQINGSWLVRFKDEPHVGSRFAPVEYGEAALDFLCMNESPPYATV